MSLRILKHPDPRLRTKAEPVTDFGVGLARLVRDMRLTMTAAHGLGLAAPQVGEALRVFVLAHSPELVFVNPEIVSAVGTQRAEEGCLSVPGEFAEVYRHLRLTVRAENQFQRVFTLEASGLLACAIQHEMDHLDGVLFIDHVSVPTRRARPPRRPPGTHEMLAGILAGRLG